MRRLGYFMLFAYIIFIFASVGFEGRDGFVPSPSLLRLDELVGFPVLLDGFGSDAVAKVAESLEVVSLFLEHGENGFHGVLEDIVLHLGLVWPRSAGEDGAASEPHLVGLGTVADEGQLGHVGAGAAVGTTRHADKNLLVVNVELGQDRTNALDVAGHDALRLCLGEAAEGKRGTGHGKAGERIDLLDGLDAVVLEDLLEVGPILRLDVLEHNGLGGAHDHVEVVLVDDGTKA
mmetsp:Transcript_26864/g.63115  ORF Transcript_26864/g.63115 Transcript_26864/m.63115 type:complete len:233 (-) Transcript_26864:1631-2329(-)